MASTCICREEHACGGAKKQREGEQACIAGDSPWFRCYCLRCYCLQGPLGSSVQALFVSPCSSVVNGKVRKKRPVCEELFLSPWS